MPRRRSANSRARASRSSQSRRACSASGSRSLRSQRTPVALREELTATARERIWRFIALPYLRPVSRRLHWTVLGLSLAVGVGIGAVIAVARSSSTAPAAPVADTRTPAIGEPAARSRRAAQRDGSRLHADRPVRQARLAALAPRQGRRRLVQRPRVHDHLPAHDDGAAPRQEAARAGGARGSSCSGSAPTPRRRRSSGCGTYSQAHGMLHKWRFLTGSLPELKRVWRAYGIEAAVVNGTIDHTPATYVIDPRRPRVAALPDADGVLEREPARVRARAEHRRAASRPPAAARHAIPRKDRSRRPAAAR